MGKLTDNQNKCGDIKITKEMEEAGSDALSSYDDRFESATDAAVRVFLAMLSAMRRGRDADRP